MGFLEVTLGLRAAALPMVQASFGVVFLGQGVVFLGDPRHLGKWKATEDFLAQATA